MKVCFVGNTIKPAFQLRASTQNAPNQNPNPQVPHVLNEVVRRIDRKLLRTLVPVSTKEKTFDREQLSSQNVSSRNIRPDFASQKEFFCAHDRC